VLGDDASVIDAVLENGVEVILNGEEEAVLGHEATNAVAMVVVHPNVVHSVRASVVRSARENPNVHDSIPDVIVVGRDVSGERATGITSNDTDVTGDIIEERATRCTNAHRLEHDLSAQLADRLLGPEEGFRVL
jgi:hypothetical protein